MLRSTYMHEKLKKRWLSRRIIKRLAKEYPFDMVMRVSHETIYRYIYVLSRGSLKTTLIKALRRRGKYRRSQKRGHIVEMRGKIADILSIEERPGKVADRIILGHWEGNLIVGKHKLTAISTLVERTTQYTIVVPLKAKDPESVRKAYAKEPGGLPIQIAKTLTYDQGKEMNGHKQFTTDTAIQVCFAHPGSPWARCTNENTNGLTSRYFLKGIDFSTVSIPQLKRVQRELNDRHYAVLNYKKPDEVLSQLIALKV